MENMKAAAGESPSMLRQRWIEGATLDLRKHFTKAGYDVPMAVRVSIGWGYGQAEKILGQCWPVIASSDKHTEIFIAPSLKDGVTIFGVIAHELIHAVDNNKHGHKGPFKEMALAVGLEGKMTATTPGPAMVALAQAFIAKHGAYPAGSLSKDKGRKKQSTRLVKCECSECGYIVRTTKKWIEDKGPPRCGVLKHGAMNAEEGEEPGDE